MLSVTRRVDKGLLENHVWSIQPVLLAYATAVILSMLLSCWMVYRVSVINPDAICYLQSALTMPQGFSKAMHVCGQAQWPFYSLAIASVARVTSLSVTQAAYVIDAFFSMLSVVFFMRLMHFFKPSLRVLWLSAGVILCAHTFNILRSEIIRDHGFWAFYLISLFYALHYLESRRAIFAVFWSVSIVIATVFRVEGAVFLMVFPWMVWFEKRRMTEKTLMFLQLNALIILFGAVFFSFGHNIFSFSRLHELAMQWHYGFASVMTQLSQLLPVAARQCWPIAFIGLFFILAFKFAVYSVNVINDLSLINAVLAGYAWIVYRSLVKGETRRVLGGYFLINVIITFTFFIENGFTTTRYLMALSLTILCWVPLALDGMMTVWRVHPWKCGAVGVLIAISAIGGVVQFGHSKFYIRAAGDFLANTTPVDAKIYSNDLQLMYYSRHFGNEIFEKSHEFSNVDLFLSNGYWKQFDYLAIRINQPTHGQWNSLLKRLSLSPIRVFSNRRGDAVLIYAVNNVKEGH